MIYLSTDVALRLSGHQVYVALPSLVLIVAAGVLPATIHNWAYVVTWEAVVNTPPLAAYGVLVGLCIIAAGGGENHSSPCKHALRQRMHLGALV